jgi:hypothetical protein
MGYGLWVNLIQRAEPHHGLGLGGEQFLGTKNSSPSFPCNSSGSS